MTGAASPVSASPVGSPAASGAAGAGASPGASGPPTQAGPSRFAVDLFSTLPIHFSNSESGATLISSGARLSVARPLALPHQLRLVPGLGFSMELTHIRPELSSPAALPAAASFVFDPTIRAVVGIERSWGRWSLRAIVGLDFVTRPVHYVVTLPTDTEVVRTPWQDRPFAAIILGARL